MVASGVISASALSASGTAARSSSSATSSASTSASTSAEASPSPPTAPSTSTPPSATSTSSSSPSSSIQVVRDLAQHGRDLRAVRLVGVLPAAQVGADAVEQLHEVFDDDRHVVRGFALQLHEAR